MYSPYNLSKTVLPTIPLTFGETNVSVPPELPLVRTSPSIAGGTIPAITPTFRPLSPFSVPPRTPPVQISPLPFPIPPSPATNSTTPLPFPIPPSPATSSTGPLPFPIPPSPASSSTVPLPFPVPPSPATSSGPLPFPVPPSPAASSVPLPFPIPPSPASNSGPLPFPVPPSPATSSGPLPFPVPPSPATSAATSSTTRVPPILNIVPAEKIPKPLVLRPWQVDWAQRAYQILLRNHGYIDTTKTGGGKTFVLIWLALLFGFPLIIICPKIMVEVWKTETAKYGVRVIAIISYESLRSQTNRQPKHGFLVRHDHITDGGVHQISFVPTQAYLDLVRSGVMVVCDEIQRIKNNSAQYKACNALIRPIISAGGTSRFALLSGSPLDKVEHAVNLLRLIGYIRAYRLYNYIKETRELILEGMQELIDACRFIDTMETEAVLAEIPMLKGKMNELAYTLYKRVVRRNISGSNPGPPDLERMKDVKNGFYNLTPGAVQAYRDAVRDLGRAARFDERTGTTDMRGNNLGAITTALLNIENAKVEIFARVGTSILMASPFNKVIIAINYPNTTLPPLQALLIHYNPLILTGKTNQKHRQRIIDMFNNDPNYRLLIMNILVGGTGISLHDQTGTSPRFMLISPSYRMIETHQAVGRISRDIMHSTATVRVMYANLEDTQEDRILHAMAQKSGVLKGILETDVDPDIMLPGDYIAEREP